MQTQGHVILNLGILGRKEHPDWTWPIMLGALYPDAGLYGFYAWTKLVLRLPDSQIWRTTYFQDDWQIFFSFFNSIPIALVALGIALYYKRSAIAAFWGAAILHCLEDFPLHHDDGYRHFWPLSNFRFESPVSYWDSDHHAVWGAGIELILILISSVFVWRRTRSRWGKFWLILFGTLYVVFYAWAFGPFRSGAPF